MKVFVGTSGFSYSWNPDGLDWYLAESRLNCIELNASFYRFPFPNQVKGWLDKTRDLNKDVRWIVKVNRLITHIFKLNERALETWDKFRKLFLPLDELVDFYLFQFPPSVKPSLEGRIESFVRKVGLAERVALEFRHAEWFKEEWAGWSSSMDAIMVSVDSPDLPREVHSTNGIVYERMHGRGSWYSYDYSKKELSETASRIKSKKPKKAYVLFNNDHDMLNNARSMLGILNRNR